MRVIIFFGTLLFCINSYAVKEYHWRDECNKTTYSISQCTDEQTEHYRQQLKQLVDKRYKYLKDFAIKWKKDNDLTEDDLSATDDAVLKAPDKFMASQDAWLKFVNLDCQEGGFCVAHHMLQRILDLESLERCMASDEASGTPCSYTTYLLERY